jgi:hypothetical protein
MGVTGSLKAVLDNGTLQHAAHIQTVDITRQLFETPRGTEVGFRDSYRYNVAAYELAKLLGIVTVPPSVERRVDGVSAAVTWWVDDVAMTELDRHKSKVQPPRPVEWQRQMNTVHVFDELIYNTDRNLGNLVITAGWQIWMIDHTRAFRRHKSCRNLNALRQIERSLLAGLKTLNTAAVRQRLGKYLAGSEIEGLIARRDLLVKHYDELILSQGEAAVVYDSLSPRESETEVAGLRTQVN